MFKSYFSAIPDYVYVATYVPLYCQISTLILLHVILYILTRPLELIRFDSFKEMCLIFTKITAPSMHECSYIRMYFQPVTSLNTDP